MAFIILLCSTSILILYLESLCRHYSTTSSTYHWLRISSLHLFPKTTIVPIPFFSNRTGKTSNHSHQICFYSLHLIHSVFIYSLLPSLDIVLVYCFVTSLLYLLATIDWVHGILPDPLVYVFLLSGFLLSPVYLHISKDHLYIGVVLGFFFLFIINSIYQHFFGSAGIGKGDMKFLAGIGAWLGWQPLNMVLLCASLSALLFVVLYKDLRSALLLKLKIPFGTFLAISCWVIFIFKITAIL